MKKPTALDLNRKTLIKVFDPSDLRYESDEVEQRATARKLKEMYEK